MMPYREVRTERLYVKAPGTDRLRKTAAGQLRHLLATGWEETGRRVRSDQATPDQGLLTDIAATTLARLPFTASAADPTTERD